MPIDYNQYDRIIPNTLYHYTSFEKFKCILQYGTWRFKLSTQSNDLLDTKYIIDLIKKIEFQDNVSEEYRNLLSLLNGFLMRDEYKTHYLSYVTCFTNKVDSRLLWDAYTINRPQVDENDKRDYNGVCIAVNRNKLLNLLRQEKPDYCDSGLLAPIWYTEEKQIASIDFLLKSAIDTFNQLKNDKDQSQNIIPTIKTGYSLKIGDYIGEPHFFKFDLKKSFVHTLLPYVESIEKTAPFLKHKFWEEENEYRASYNLHISKKPKNNYIDINITEDLFDYVILGPTFSEKEVEKINKIRNPKLDFDKLKQQASIGTGIIHMK